MMVLLVLFAMSALAQVDAQPVEKVEPNKVCMINEQYMNAEQIPVEVEGKTYYGCCKMCVERLNNDAESRFAIDPVSRNKVDKAKAVIGATAEGRVFYFESEKNLELYNNAAKKE